MIELDPVGIGVGMWIFAYGSLMGDGWENDFRCLRREIAVLRGYRRSFTKASIVNWGSKLHPCPTLRVIQDPMKMCVGTIFEFNADGQQAIEYLTRREGRNFDLTDVKVDFRDGTIAAAKTFLYTGSNLIATDDVSELAKLLILARGRGGTGLDYLNGVRKELQSVEVIDEAVDKLARAVADEVGRII